MSSPAPDPSDLRGPLQGALRGDRGRGAALLPEVRQVPGGCCTARGAGGCSASQVDAAPGPCAGLARAQLRRAVLLVRARLQRCAPPSAWLRQVLEEFSGEKRTCQRALDSHNARRRKRDEERRQAGTSSLKRSGSSLRRSDSSASPASKAATTTRRRARASPSGERGDGGSASVSEQPSQRRTPSSAPSVPAPEAPAAGPALLPQEGCSSLPPLSHEQGSNHSLLQGRSATPNQPPKPASPPPPAAMQPRLGSTPPAGMQPQSGSPLYGQAPLTAALQPQLGLSSPAQIGGAAALLPIPQIRSSSALAPQCSAMSLAAGPAALAMPVAAPAAAVPAAHEMLGAQVRGVCCRCRSNNPCHARCTPRVLTPLNAILIYRSPWPIRLRHLRTWSRRC